MNEIEIQFLGAIEALRESRKKTDFYDYLNIDLLELCIETENQIIENALRYKLRGDDTEALNALRSLLSSEIEKFKQRVDAIETRNDISMETEAAKLAVSVTDFKLWFESLKLQYLGQISENDFKVIHKRVWGHTAEYTEIEDVHFSNREHKLSQSEVGFLYHYLVFCERVEQVKSVEKATILAKKFGWEKSYSGKSLLDEINRFNVQSSRIGLTEIKKSDNNKKRMFEVIIKFLQDNLHQKALAKAKDEYAIFINHYTSFYQVARK